MHRIARILLLAAPLVLLSTETSAQQSRRTHAKWTPEQLFQSLGPAPQGWQPPGWVTHYEAPRCTSIEACLDLAVMDDWPIIDVTVTWMPPGHLVFEHPRPQGAAAYPGHLSTLRHAYNLIRRAFTSRDGAVNQLLAATAARAAAPRHLQSSHADDMLEIRARHDAARSQLIVVALLHRHRILSGSHEQRVCAPCAVPNNGCPCAMRKTNGPVGSVHVGLAHRLVFDSQGGVLEQKTYEPTVIEVSINP